MTSIHIETVRTLIETRLHAALERWYQGDVHGYLSLFADDCTYFDPWSGGCLAGIDVIRTHFKRFDGKVFRTRFEVRHPAMRMRGDGVVLAYELQSWQEDGKADTPWMATEVYAPVAGDWRIVHAHWSMPM